MYKRSGNEATHSHLPSSFPLPNLPVSYHIQFLFHLSQTLLGVIKLSAENTRRKHHILHRVNSLVGKKRKMQTKFKILTPPPKSHKKNLT